MSVLVFLGFIKVMVLTDIVVKTCVENSIKRGEERFFLNNKIIVRKVYNRGFLLNTLEENSEYVKFITLIITFFLTCVTCIALLRKGSLVKRLGLGLMTAGAWGNVTDRFLRGYVIDFLAINTTIKKLKTITFNFADVFILIGWILYAIGSCFGKKKS